MARKSKPSPAFSFYPDDWLGSTKITLMTPAEEGAYIRLLAHQWNEPDCTIPGDDESLSKLSRLKEGWLKSRERLLRCFRKLKSGRLQNQRLKAERDKQRERSAERSESGVAGANGRWNREKHAETRDRRLSDARKIARHSALEWAEMLTFFSGKCVKCGTSEGCAVKDHIIPIYQGGSDGIGNIQPLCKLCNSAKGSESIDWRVINCFKLTGKQASEMPAKWLAKAGFPSSSPSPSPKEGGAAAADDTEGVELEATMRAFDRFETPGEPAKLKAIRDLRRQRVAHDRIREAAAQNPTSDFYAVVGLLRNGKVEAPFKPSHPSTSKRRCSLPGCVEGHVVDHEKTVSGGTTIWKDCPECSKAGVKP